MPNTPPAVPVDNDLPTADTVSSSTDDPVLSTTGDSHEARTPGTAQRVDFLNPSDCESESSDEDSLPGVSQILSQCTSKGSLQADVSQSRDSEPLEYLSQDEGCVDIEERPPPPPVPMAKEEVIDEPLPMPSPLTPSRTQTRKSLRKSNQAPPASSSSSPAAKVVPSTGSTSTTRTSTPKSKAGTGESSKKGASTRKRKLNTVDEVLPQVSASQPPPAQ